MSWRCWYCAWKVMVLSNSATTASKPPSSSTAPVSKPQRQRRRQEAQALQVAAAGQQAPAVVARHAVGLRAGHRGGVAGQRLQHPQRLDRRSSRRRSVRLRAAAQELLLGAHDHVPLLLRQALAHGRGGAAQRARGCSPRWSRARVSARPAISERSNTRRACGGRRHGRQHQCIVDGHLAQPGQQRLRRLVLAVEAFERQPRQPRGVLGALGVAAQPEQVLGRAAGDAAAAVRDRRRPAGRGAAGWWRRLRRRSAPRCRRCCRRAASRRSPASAPAMRVRPPGSTRQDCGAVGHREHAQHQRARHDAVAGRAVLPGGHLRQRQVGLHRVLVGFAHDAAGPFVELAARQVACPAPRRRPAPP